MVNLNLSGMVKREVALMWISRSKYNELQRIERRYETLLQVECRRLRSEDSYRNLLHECEKQLEQYKQKYTDEVQKRLELAELVDRLSNTKEME